MNSGLFRLRPLALAVAALVAASGLSTDSTYASSPVDLRDDGVTVTQTANSPFVVSNKIDEAQTGRYIVRYAELPAPTYFAQNGNQSAQQTNAFTAKGARGRMHLDTSSSQVKSYVQQLQASQSQHLNTITAALGRTPNVVRTFQYAINAVVLDGLSASDLSKLHELVLTPGSGIVAVSPDYIRHSDTDIGPGFIGASSIWFGSPAGQDSLFANGFEIGQGYRGDGIVIGDIDTGYNSLSPSFAATDDQGYVIQNPLGTGNFIGDCGLPNISLGGCNDKVIGVYDELSGSNPGEPTRSVEDNILDGHGSHTGSTAGGNSRSATVNTYTAAISGVAPHANMIIYRGLYNGSGTTVDLTAAAEQAIQDGIVDALNYSISGGTNPWNDPVSLAFLSAADAGIFVAAAAGNTSTGVPVALPGTANHLEPWVTSAAASTHTGGPLVDDVIISGPATPPNPLLFVTFSGAHYSGFRNLLTNTPMKLSPQFHNTDTAGTDGCSAVLETGTGYPAGTFTGDIAVISRGTCTYGDKALSAQNAGAVAVIVSDNRVEDVSQLSFTLDDAANSFSPTITIPVFFVAQADGTAMNTYLTTNTTGVTATTPPARRFPVQADVLASFSLLGPTSFGVVKPDIQAPGVAILAAVANNAALSGPNSVDFYNGTSMATPHTTGTGALLMGLHPDWTPLETKSAIMMTAKEVGLTKPNGTTPSDFFDRGAGRIQAYVASKAGLVLNETGLNFTNANPATGGNPNTLNLASMQSESCLTVGVGATCSFTRRFRSTQDHSVTWAISFTGDIGTSTSTPSSLVVGAHANGLPVTINVDMSAASTSNSYHFGEMVLTPNDANLTPLHLPMAIKVPLPSISATPRPLSISIPPASASNTGTLTVHNDGGPTLNVTNTNDTTGHPVSVVIDQASTGTFGFYNDFWTDQGGGAYTADDFTVSIPGTNLSKASFPGFTLAGGALATLAGRKIHFEIYGNAAGIPNGNPETLAPSYVWNYVATIGGTGLTVTNNTIALNFATATGITPTNLAVGTYWMVVYLENPTIGTGQFANGWLWFESTVVHGSNAHNISPVVFGVANWTDNAAGGDQPSMAMHIETIATCGAPWLTASPSTLTIGALGSAPLTVTADSTQFPVGATSVDAYLCLDSNDVAKPIYATPIHATGGTGLVVAPTVAKAFSPTTVLVGDPSTATITLSNGSSRTATLTAALTDTMPAGLVASGPAATTCASGTASVAGGGGSVTLTAGAQIPAAGSCTVTFSASSATANPYTNTIAIGDLQTDKGSNAAAGSATLTVTAIPLNAPTVSEAFSPTTAQAYDASTLTLTFGNTNATAATLTGNFVDTLPAGLVVATVPAASTTCAGGTLTATAGAGSFTLTSGAQIPANSSCTIAVNVLSTTANTYTNTVNAGDLQTDKGNNASTVTANLTVTALPAICSGQTLLDPSFELTSDADGTNPNWASVDTADAPAGALCTTTFCGSALARTGNAFTWFGGFGAGTVEDGTVSQSVVVPSGFDRTLNFYMRRLAPTGGGVSSLVVSVDGTTLNTYPNVTVSEAGFTKFSLPLASAVSNGATHGFQFHFSKPLATGSTGSDIIDDVTLDCTAGGPPTVSKAFAPNNVNTNTSSTLTVTLTNANAVTATLTSPLTDTLPGSVVVASTPGATTTCASGIVTATAGAGSVTLNSGAQIPASGSCTVSVSVQSPTGGIFVNSIPAGALATNMGGSNPLAASATIQVNGGAPAYSTGFESPFTIAAINAQQGWSANTDWLVSAAHPQAGTQELRGTWAAAGSGTTVAISPSVTAGTSTYSTTDLDVAMTASGTGATFDLRPQDPAAGLIITDVEFLKGTNAILVLDASDSLFHATTGTWTGSGTYQHVQIVVNRATKSLAVCLNGTNIYNGLAFAGNTSNVAIRGTKGAGTQANLFDGDNLVVDNLNSPAAACTPPIAPLAPTGAAVSAPVPDNTADSIRSMPANH